MTSGLRLIADVGGTNARFAIERAPQAIDSIEILACDQYPSLLAALQFYLKMQQVEIKNFVIAIANPVTGDAIKMTNHHWQFSIKQLKQELAAEQLLVINDFTAQALALSRIEKNQFCVIGTPSAPEHDYPQAQAVVGAGTGLGVSGLIPDQNGNMIALAGDGGHVAFAPRGRIERALLAFAERKIGGHISAERLLCGAGLTLMYEFFATRENAAYMPDISAAAVTSGALHDQNPICMMVLERYCRILGDTCANVALTLGATGGVFICGGIVPRFVDFLQQSAFRQSFEDKGRLRAYMQKIPVYVVEHPHSGLLGASVALEQYLQTQSN